MARTKRGRSPERETWEAAATSMTSRHLGICAALSAAYGDHIRAFRGWPLSDREIRAALRRVRSINNQMAAGRPSGAGEDAPGLAMRARPSREVETIQAGVRAEQMEDADWLDVLARGNAITLRGRDALSLLRDEYQSARPPGSAACGLSARGKMATWGVVDEAAWRAYRRALEALPAETREAVRTVAVDGEWPLMGNAAALVRQGSERLADFYALAADPARESA